MRPNDKLLFFKLITKSHSVIVVGNAGDGADGCGRLSDHGHRAFEEGEEPVGVEENLQSGGGNLGVAGHREIFHSLAELEGELVLLCVLLPGTAEGLAEDGA